MHFEADAQALLQRHAGQGQKDEDLEKMMSKAAQDVSGKRIKGICIDANMEYIYIRGMLFIYKIYICNIVKQREIVYCIYSIYIYIIKKKSTNLPNFNLKLNL